MNHLLFDSFVFYWKNYKKNRNEKNYEKVEEK